MKRLLILFLLGFTINTYAQGDSLKVIAQKIKEQFVLQTQNLKSEDISVTMPNIIIQDIDFNVGFKILKENFADNVKLTIDVNGKNYPVKFVNKEGSLTLQAKEDGKLTFTFIKTKAKIEENINVIPLWASILPPLIAIIMALIFREVISSLFIGIFIGALILALNHSQYGIIDGIWWAFVEIFEVYILQALVSEDHQSVILFSMTIGAMVAVISKNGGMQGVVDRISKWAKDAKSGQLVTWFLGISIFFDDYANTLVVGNTMRPVTDRLKISREKLAYLVDSTAAPVAAIAFVTTWIGAELGYIQGGIDKIAENSNLPAIQEGAYGIFMGSLSYSFYPIFTLVFMLFLILSGKDFGPMLKAENRARITGKVSNAKLDQDDNEDEVSDDMEEFTAKEGVKAKAFNAIIPVFTVIGITLFGIFYTGFASATEELLATGISADGSWGSVWRQMHLIPNAETSSFIQKLGTIVGMANSYTALIWASISGLIISIALTLGQKIMKIGEAVETAITGYKTMLPAIMILISAWALATVTEHLHTADFITSLLGDTPAWTIPFITFVLAAIVAFSTGSSWGTMAILYPLILPASWTICHQSGMDFDMSMAIFYNVTSCVLAGSVLGDHCSPISDTTILSSLASSCNHIDHVRTQLPYAVSCGLVSILIGTIPAAFGVSSWLLFPIGIAVLFILVKFVGKKVETVNE